ncbi:hypothetical protein H4Q26_016367 [Puccinia striiformis f. sp. tritici PST-130]|uniref:Uncharacterized protein n=1 Tax=Puccinia striiformis f. sp. tritici PST-78 TaxID=1165861 RepID=A0A0L0VMA4_9BASI|nr:hypothetical protein H4Q26_016367 [Puccinia striiformis f. sp. tritici PST-130]KNF00386.1 hypothetical protein PSTG_06316 [Puccinia striiformis f. sp. tritici PST-78]
MSRRTSRASHPPSVGTHNYNLRPRPHRGESLSAINPLESSSRADDVFTPVNVLQVPTSPVYQPDSPVYPSRPGSPIRRQNSPVKPRTPDSPIRRRPFVVAPETLQDLTDYLSSNRAVVDFPWTPRAPQPAVNLNPPPAVLISRLPKILRKSPLFLGTGYGDPNLESPTCDYLTQSPSVSQASRSSRHSYNRGSNSSPRRSSDDNHPSAASRRSLTTSGHQTPNNYHRLSSDQIASLLDDQTSRSSYRKCDCGSTAVDSLYKSFVAEYVKYCREFSALDPRVRHRRVLLFQSLSQSYFFACRYARNCPLAC